MQAELTLPQVLYLGVVAAYILFFLLFIRLLLWKRYADRNYWRRRPQLTVAGVREQAAALGRPVPFFSIMVPARNESDVIEGTIDHMAALQYPPDRYEVVVVTDAKEAREAAGVRAAAVQAAARFLSGARGALGEGGHAVGMTGGSGGGRLDPDAEALVLGLLTRLAMDGGEAVRRRLMGEAGSGALSGIPDLVVQRMAGEVAGGLWHGRGRLAPGRTETRLRRRLPPGTRPDRVLAGYATLLCHAIPAVVVLAHLAGRPDRRRLMERIAAHAARADQALTREILYGMAEALVGEVLQRLQPLAADAARLEAALSAAARVVFPTTQDIVARKEAEFAANQPVRPQLRHVEVPPDFDGSPGGGCLGMDVPSTKGRALNWGLGFTDPRTDWCGFYDAESRPDPRVLLYVARRWLEDLAPAQPSQWRAPRVPRPVRIFQGPVFQVRNFYEMGAFCKIAALYQAVAHDWYLPALFKRLPFVGGTNLFVEVTLLRQIGGYDHASLTEDLELGTRAFLQTGVWPEYLPLPSSEQTPPTFRGFFRQRLRWATGHLQVMEKIRREERPASRERRGLLRELFRKGQCEWVFYQSATLVPPLALGLHWGGMLDPGIMPPFARWVMNSMSSIYILFTVYIFYRYSEHLDRAAQPPGWLRGHAGAMAQLLLMPLAAFLLPVPYSSALVLHRVGLHPRMWEKTPRTRE